MTKVPEAASEVKIAEEKSISTDELAKLLYNCVEKIDGSPYPRETIRVSLSLRVCDNYQLLSAILEAYRKQAEDSRGKSDTPLRF